ncbi:MlaD family protein [Candidatus Uabimicrobium amorphum]|uniref:Glycerophosphoryl diester phosphodiesterase n=1 Tax=Uabimicrobium amorphum TaxID=2596890 RepID=A0A5S9F6G8_UABAM|nr:MlaD family protein [Candidatus Uabimicrobium amorphum]BBM87875.1 glycerophosphoryl diester phosphodiesterase [Candidatus Uabimicrobium amorphum]
MNKSGYYKIGLFTISGFILFAAMITMLGAGAALENSYYVETYFNESIQGLSIGAPVKYRGVQIGSVHDIDFCQNRYTSENAEYTGYVYIRIAIYPKLVGSDENAKESERQKRLQELIDRGMRTRLAQQGITGLAYIELDFFKHTKDKLGYDWKPKNIYIPSTESTISQVSDSIVTTLEKIQNVDFESIASNVNRLIITTNKLVATVEKGVSDIDVEGARKDIQNLINRTSDVAVEVERFSARINEFLGDPELESVPKDVSRIVNNFAKMTADMQDFTKELQPIAKTLSESVNNSIQNFGKLGEELTQLTKDIDDIVRQQELKDTIAEMPQIAKQWTLMAKRLNMVIRTNQANINQAVRNLRIFAEHLKQVSKNAEKYPAQLLFGDPPARERNK